MKVEDPPAFLVQWFYHKHNVLPKGDGSSWQNYTKFAVRSATTKRTFIVMEKTYMDTRNTCVSAAGFNGRQNQAGKLDVPEQRNILPALSAEKPLFCTTTGSIMPTTPAVTRSAAILCLCQSPRPFQPHPCPGCSVRRISSGCVTLSMSSSWP